MVLYNIVREIKKIPKDNPGTWIKKLVARCSTTLVGTLRSPSGSCFTSYVVREITCVMLGTVEATDSGKPRTAQTGRVSAPRTNRSKWYPGLKRFGESQGAVP